jgi:hypothetical protein
MSESNDQPNGYEISRTKPLDRDNLPPEFTVEFLRRCSPREAIWLESEAELTELQRTSLQAAAHERWGLITAPFRGRATAIFEQFSKVGSSARGMDRLGREMHETMTSLTKAGKGIASPPPPVDFAFTPKLPPISKIQAERHQQQQESLRMLHETSEQTTRLLAQLVERTEQQHRAAERQKATNWTLAVIAGASMAGTFATVSDMSHFWFALIATLLVAGVLYVVMH